MSAITKLISLWAVGKTLSNTTPLLLRLLLGMVVIAIGTAFAAILITVLIIGAVWFSYTQMIAASVEPLSAVLIIAAVLVGLIALVSIIIGAKFKKLRLICRELSISQAPLSSRVSNITDAFIQGLFNEHPRR